MPISPQPPDEPLDVDALAAALRADSADLAVYSRVLVGSLAEALPADLVEVVHDPSLRDRVAGRPGPVSRVRIALGDDTFELVPGRGGVPAARMARAVRGVVISSREVSVEEWTQLLAVRLAARAQDSASARVALGRLLGMP